MSDPDPSRAQRRESAFGLARRFIGQLVDLAKLEVTHARQEVGEMLGTLQGAAVSFGLALALVLISLITLDVVLALGIAALFEALPNLVVAAIVAVILVAMLAAAVALSGGGLLRLPWYGLLAVLLVLAVLLAAFALPAYLGFRAAWHSALFLMVLQLLGAGLFAWRGVRSIRIGPPEETIASVKEDVAWVKRLVRRG